MEIEDRLESLILRVGEKSTSSLESNLEGLASVLEADLSTYKSKILKILVECAVKLPDKCTIYTTLIGLLNTKNYNFGGECVGGGAGERERGLYIVVAYLFPRKKRDMSVARGALRVQGMPVWGLGYGV